jgi:hypothetical protein
MFEEKPFAEKDVLYAYDYQLKEWAASKLRPENRQMVDAEILRRMQFKSRAAEPPAGWPPSATDLKPSEIKPSDRAFDPREDISADAKRIVGNLSSIDKSVKTIKDVVVWWVVLTLGGAALWVVYIFTR